MTIQNKNITKISDEYCDTYKKANESSHSCEQDISSTLVKYLTKSEIESLRQNKRDAYALMKYIEDTNEMN